MEDGIIFALDIGTRKILGLVMQKVSSSYRVLASEMIEHRTRAMYDGQIHDVEAVAENIERVKNALEERLQITLDSAAVAAAGRALKTSRGRVLKRRSNLDEIKLAEVRALEIEAVQQAQYELAQKETDSRGNSNYICAGYSVVAFTLEGQELASLVGQVGSEMAVEVIATFLPRVVIDSLLSSLRKVGLKIFSLTLEPIAALSVAIPPEMRLLNLVLVDIGAGTSDIAVVKENSIFAYAMVPLGGDELTEQIATQYLLDFNTAEQVKRLLSTNKEIELLDILGNHQQVAGEEILQGLEPVIDQLASSVAEEIMALNQKSPDAVICIGGGSLTPGLPARIAEKLGLPLNRVGIRTPDRFYNIEVPADFLKGPQGVTPLGIAYNSFTVPPVPFIKVRVNEREVALWNIGDLNVATALLSSGISMNNMYGKPGMGKTILMNGQLRVIKGELGSSPIIRLNGEEANLETPVFDDARIEYQRGRDGRDALILVRDMLPFTGGSVTVNDKVVRIKAVVTVDGKDAYEDEEIPDRARVEYQPINTLARVLALAGVPEHLINQRVYRYYVNGQEMVAQWLPIKVRVDGGEAKLEDTVGDGAVIKYSLAQLRPRLRDVIDASESFDLNITVNDKKVRLKGKGAVMLMNDRVVDLDQELEDEARIFINKGLNSAIFSDVFQVVEIQMGNRGRLVMKVDGQAAGYTTPIYEDSVVELYWMNP
ncbi:MAG TPA: cell division FtsA domain-containing protein [Syntrophomonadaceae bacterium]|nr:cell division FtsA domain-containing protein [Syntrophomonadaceae bacterium]